MVIKSAKVSQSLIVSQSEIVNSIPEFFPTKTQSPLRFTDCGICVLCAFVGYFLNGILPNPKLFIQIPVMN